MNKIAYIHWGNSSQMRSFQDFSYFIDQAIYINDLNDYDLNVFTAIIVPDGIASQAISLGHTLSGDFPPDKKIKRLCRHQAKKLNDYVRNGGFLIVFCQGNTDWIDVVELNWMPIMTKDWLWWTRPDGQLEIHQPHPEHPICKAIPLSDMSWHWGGAYSINDNAISILNLNENNASLFLDFQKLKGGGRLLVSTLDPHSHNGQRFMPATTRFLKSFYPWLNQELKIRRPKKIALPTYNILIHFLKIIRNGLKPACRKSASNQFFPLYGLEYSILENTDIPYIPGNHDQLFLCDRQKLLLDYLTHGGNLIICGEPSISWLPFLGSFHAVPPRPFTNLDTRNDLVFMSVL